jgi:2-polyprenyl-3-methyl-5-hydroxy-6-metoxy-1,4-benzoquinol methylase
MRDQAVKNGATLTEALSQVKVHNVALYAKADMIQCPSCGLISIDPIPSEDIIKDGCRLLYQLQQPQEKRSNVIRGFSKSYRRGALFARKYLKELAQFPKINILEIGAGDGYFSEGIRSTLSQTEVWLLDIVPELCEYYSEHFKCKTIQGELNSLYLERDFFDAILFRDLLEHTQKPFDFLKKVNAFAKQQGKIFFITPNGKEDFWMINQRFIKTGTASLLLLNHFHYFLPETLSSMLDKLNFKLDVGFKFGLKHHQRGLGHREFSEFDSEKLPPIESSDETVDKLWQHNKEEVVSGFLNNLNSFSKLYSSLVDTESQKIDFMSAHGHEFFILASKA